MTQLTCHSSNLTTPRDWIVLVDGARHQLDLIQAEAARRDVSVHILLDFVHVAEYGWTAAHAFHPPGSRAAETWVADKLTSILAGNADRAAMEMSAQAAAEHLPPTRREAVTTCRRYLAGHLGQLHYDTALAAGWPIPPAPSKAPAATSSPTASTSPAPDGDLPERKPCSSSAP